MAAAAASGMAAAYQRAGSMAYEAAASCVKIEMAGGSNGGAMKMAAMQ
jgi:hypothetical protein